MGLSRLPLDLAWTLKMWQLEEAGRPLTSLRPNIVTVKEYGNGTTHQFWPPKRKPRERKMKTEILGAKEQSLSTTLGALEDGDPNDKGEYEEEEEVEDDIDPDDHCDPNEEDEYVEDETIAIVSEALDYLMNEETIHQAAGAGIVPQPDQAIAGNTKTDENMAEQIETEAAVVPAVQLPSVAASASTGPVAEGGAPTDVLSAGPMRVAGVRGVSSYAAACVHVTGGKLSYYVSKEGFQADCTVHPGCNLSRVAHARKKRSRTGILLGGRPCGLMMRWLEDGKSCATKSEHKCVARLASYTYEQRLKCRETLQSTVDGRAVLSFERALEATEQDEPLALDGYL
eukprot:6490863-Amphidinium_carterae.3